MTSFQIAMDPIESMLSPGRSPARNRRRLSKGGAEKENPDPKSPQSILKKGEQRRALGELHMFDVRSPAAVEMVNGQSIEASPVFRKKKAKRSLSRRVSFAEKPAVRIFVKDTEYETPPDAKAQKAGPRPTEPTAELNGAPPAQPPPEDFTFGMDGSADSGLLQFELLPAGNTGPVPWGQAAEGAAEGNTEPLTWGNQLGARGTQQTTPPMQQQQPGGKHQATPQGTPGGNESSPEFFSPRNFVSPLSSDDGMELTHTPTADFELLPPQNEAFGSAFSNRRRSSLGGGPHPSFWGFDADLKSSPEGEQAPDLANFTDMTGSITAMVPKLAKILAEQQDFTFNTGLVGERNGDAEEETKMTAVSPVPSDMSLTPINDELPTQQQEESAEAKKAGFTFTASPPRPEEKHGRASGRKFGDLLAFEDDQGAGQELFEIEATDDRRNSITEAIPRLQDLLATDVEGGREETTMRASKNRRSSITGAIPNLQALLEADQGRQEKSGEEAAAAQQEEAELPNEDVFDFGVNDRVGQIGSPAGGETTQLLNFEAFAKKMGAELLAAAKGDENVTASVPCLADLVDADGAETQTNRLRKEKFDKTEQEVRAEEPQDVPPPAAGIAKTVLPLVFTGDEQDGLFGSRSRFGGSVRPSHGRASLQPSTNGGIRPLHRRGSVRGRASVGSGWAAMLNEEAQEQSMVNRWWVKDKPGMDNDLVELQEQAGDGEEAEEKNTQVHKSETVVTDGVKVASEVTETKTVPSVPQPSLLLLPSTTPSTKLPPASLPEANLEAPSSKKRSREETEPDFEAQSEQITASPQPATKKQRTMQTLTPVTEQMSALEREESQGTLFKIANETGTQEVTQFEEKELSKETIPEQEEDRGAMQEEIPTQHSAVLGGLRNGAGSLDSALFGGPSTVVGQVKEPSELEYQMLRLEINGTAPPKSPSPNTLPVLSRLQLRRSAVRMQSALTTVSSQEKAAAPATAEIVLPKKHDAAPQGSVTSQGVVSYAIEPPLDSQAQFKASAPTKEQQVEDAPPPANEPLKTQPIDEPLAREDAPAADLSAALPEPPASQALAEGPAEPQEDVTESTLPLPPTRLQGLMHLRRESLGVLPPTQSVPFQNGLGKVSTPAAHRGFTPRGQENFTPLIGLSSVRKFRTPAADKAAPEAVRTVDTTAEMIGEEENIGKVPGKISFAEFLYKAEVRFLDVRHRASMFAQQTPTAEVAPPSSLADSLKVVCFHQPQATILAFGCGELRETIAAKKASVAHFETKLQDTCPAIFQAVQTATGAERAALLKKLKDLKQRCRLEARRQWLEWRLKLEENASERLQENEQTLVEDLTAIQGKRQQLHELRAQIQDLHAQVQAETQQAQAQLRAAEEREEETRNLKLRLMADMRQQQTELERREVEAGQAQEYAHRMAAKKQAAEAEQQQVLDRLHAVESECAAARAALISSGAAGDDGLGNGRIAIDATVMEQLKVKGDGRREELVTDLHAIASTQGWVITKVGWQTAQKEGGDQLQGQEDQMVAGKAGTEAEAPREGVIELQHHSGLFTHTIFSTTKDECPLESMLQTDEKAIAEAYPLVEGAAAFAAGVLGPIGQRMGNAEGRSTGSLVQEASLRIGRLFDLLEELADCRRDFAALSSITCTTAEGAGVPSLRFVNHTEGLMFTLAFSVAQVSGSAYPFGKLPLQMTVQFAGLSSSQQVLENSVKAAISGVPPGFGRFTRLCSVLSQLSSRPSNERIVT